MRHFLLLVALMVGALLVSTAPAWWVKGHESIADAATVGLPAEVPAFFRAGGKTLALFAGDPDRWKNRTARFLKAAEFPNHFLDLEDLDGKEMELPQDRFKGEAFLRALKRRPEETGLLPYALMENFDRLCCAFYDHRADPENPTIRMKCLAYAGILSHYTGDTAMPLHTTRDYDGKKGGDGNWVQKGIHAKIDAFPEKNKFSPDEICRGLKARAIEDVWQYVLKTIKESHRFVPKCYELDAAGVIDTPTAESRAFVMERCRAGAQFTMDLWYSAWLKSAKMPPHW
jgi:hypothetical protein